VEVLLTSLNHREHSSEHGQSETLSYLNTTEKFTSVRNVRSGHENKMWRTRREKDSV